MLFLLVANLEALGGTGSNILTIMWAIVAYWAIKGKVAEIKLMAAVAFLIQVAFGIFFLYSSGYLSVAYNQDLLLFYLGVAIPAAAWAALFLWARSKDGNRTPPQIPIKSRRQNHNVSKTNYEISTPNSQNNYIKKDPVWVIALTVIGLVLLAGFTFGIL